MKRAWYILVAAFWLGSFVPGAQALMLCVEATWSSQPDGATNFGEGSIVQVVVVRSGYDVPDDSGADPKADAHFQPYGENAYQPDTVVEEGNEIIYTGSVVASSNNAPPYYFFAAIEVSSIYDQVYLRVFEADDWEQGTVVSNVHWGVSSAQDITEDQFGMAFTYWRDNISLTNVNNFEVIPEPGTVALLGIGAAGLAGWSRRRKGANRRQTGETGAEKP